MSLLRKDVKRQRKRFSIFTERLQQDSDGRIEQLRGKQDARHYPQLWDSDGCIERLCDDFNIAKERKT